MHKSTEHHFCTTSLSVIVSAGGLFATVAFAQDQTTADQSAGRLEEVVVTAQKRSETLADIPMSVTVLSGETLERRQIYDFQDLVAQVPGFSITGDTPGVTRISLRGINTGGVASTVGVYVGDVPFGSSSGLANGAILSGDFDTFDMARVEVLRGPQGTLYGASSLGGVLKYVPNSPSTEAFEAKFQGSIEDVDGGDMGYALTGAVNVPVGDNFAFRLSAFSRSNDGFIDSIGNNPIPSLTDPTIFINDGTRVAENINSQDTTGGRLSALFTPTENVSIELMAMVQEIESDGQSSVDADPVALEPLYARLAQSSYHPEWTNIEYEVYSANINWDFGPASLQSVTSYSDFLHDFQSDLDPMFAALFTFLLGDATAFPLGSISQQNTGTEKFTQEFRLLSDDNEAFEWLVGVYYTDEDSAIDPQEIFAVEAGTENIVDLPTLARASLISNYEELAVFANATWYVAPRWELSFGGRYSDNEQVASQVLEGILVGGTTNFDEARSSETPFTWSFSPRFEVDDNTSVYARVATGFRPGGPNVLPPGAPPGTPATYDSDELTSYEVGLKKSSADGRFWLDIAAYFLDWEDIQLFALINDVGVNANGGTAESKGFEFSTTFQATEALTFSLNGAYTDAYLTQDTDPIVGGMDGDPLPYIPEWSFAVNGDYEWPVLSASTAYVGGTVAYTGERTGAFNNRTADGSLREADSYTTLDLRAGVDTGTWYFELYGKNLTDEEGITSIGGASTLPNGAINLGLIRPMTIGLTVGARF